MAGRRKVGGTGPSIGLWVTIGVVVIGFGAIAVASRQGGGGGCGDGGAGEVRQAPEEPAGGANLLANPGFEQGQQGWEWLSWSKGWSAFRIVEGKGRGGGKALYLPVRSEGDARNTIVWGAVQEVVPGERFPECLEGWWQVGQWKRGTAKQYIQAVIISRVKIPGGGDEQIRMVLSGMEQPSYNLTNARYFFADPLKRVEPPVGEWVKFRCETANWFEQAWGSLPDPSLSVRVFVEARFDDRTDGDGPSVADVYFDDLYLGPCR